MTLKSAVSVGIGLFVAFIGLQDAKLIVNSDSTLVTYQTFKGETFHSVGVGAILATLTGCGSSASNISVSRNDTASFKYDYESLNGTTNSSGKEFRSITVDENSHITIATLDQINQYMDDGKTFMVYFGFSACLHWLL